MKILNIDGIVEQTCGCGGWLEHWKRLSHQALPAYCPEMACANLPELGAHAQRDDETGYRVIHRAFVRRAWREERRDRCAQPNRARSRERYGRLLERVS